MSIAVHNVVQLSDDEVLRRFVVRQHELDELLVHLRETGPPRHALVVGPRGMGKSLLLRRVAIAVAADPDLAARWLPVMMAEELYEVTSIGELWLAVLARLAGVVGDPALVEQHRVLSRESDPARLEMLTLQRVLEVAQGRGRRLLLLAENLDMLLGDQVGADEPWTLRGALQTEPDLLLMASAVTRLSDDGSENDAFYGFFHTIELRPLDDDDVRTIWQAVTGVDLAGDRAVPIRILTGGNPRLITVLGRFSRHPDLGSLREDLELLIDEYTPFFKANIEALPAIERKVFVTLADIWAPATAAEVAERARLDSNKVSSLLGRLMKRGAVAVVDGTAGPRTYELTERLYNLYHLLRRPDSDGRVRALVDVLVHMYDQTSLERDVWPAMIRPSMPEIDLAVASRLHRHLDDANPWAAISRSQATARIPVLESLLREQTATLGPDHRDTLLTRQQIAFFVGMSGDPIAALQHYESVLDDQLRVLGPDDRDTLRTRSGVACNTAETGDVEGALALSRQVAVDSERVLGPEDRETLSSRHHVAYYTGKTGDVVGALALFREVAADRERVLGPDDRGTLSSRSGVAFCAGVAGDVEEALALYRQLAADRERVLGPDDPATLRSRNNVAYCMNMTGDAEGALAIASDVLRRADASLPGDAPLVPAARWLVDRHRLQLVEPEARQAPRELREFAKALRRRK